MGEDAAGTGAGEARRGRRWARPRTVVTAAVLTAALVLGGLGWAAAQPLQLAGDDRLLPGMRIDGVDVGGLDRSAAAAAVREGAAGELDRTLTVRWPGGNTQVTVRELGTTVAAEEAVDRAFEAKRDYGWSELAAVQWRGGAVDWEGRSELDHDEDAVRRWLQLLAREVVAYPVDASFDWQEGEFRFLRERPGRRLDVAASAVSVREALEQGGDSVVLQVAALPPRLTRADFGQVLVVDQSAFRLSLYDKGGLVRSWPVAIGAPRYPTPVGEFEVTLKRHMPTWGNPAPNGWGANMPRFIGPGRHNPLGLRALNWSVGAIRFHGTEDFGSIGRRASKGCVRLRNADVVELYDLVDEGARIVSFRT